MDQNKNERPLGQKSLSEVQENYIESILSSTFIFFSPSFYFCIDFTF